jgi:hypothetical protein
MQRVQLVRCHLLQEPREYGHAVKVSSHVDLDAAVVVARRVVCYLQLGQGVHCLFDAEEGEQRLHAMQRAAGVTADDGDRIGGDAQTIGFGCRTRLKRRVPRVDRDVYGPAARGG